MSSNSRPAGASKWGKRYFEGKKRRKVAAEMGIAPRKLQTLDGGGLRKLLHNRAIKAFRDEIISSYAYKSTGFIAWKRIGESSVERSVIRAGFMPVRDAQEASEISDFGLLVASIVSKT